MADTAKTLRLFYALWPDDATRDALMQVAKHVEGSITRRENLHLTLAFLGQQPASLVPRLKEILDRIRSSPAILRLDHLGYFANPRVAWAGMDRPPASLIAMQKTLMQALAKNSVGVDASGNFRPHVTLARNAPAPVEQVLTPITWRADELVLVESITHPDGPQYRLIASSKLDGSP